MSRKPRGSRFSSVFDTPGDHHSASDESSNGTTRSRRVSTKRVVAPVVQEHDGLTFTKKRKTAAVAVPAAPSGDDTNSVVMPAPAVASAKVEAVPMDVVADIKMDVNENDPLELQIQKAAEYAAAIEVSHVNDYCLIFVHSTQTVNLVHCSCKPSTKTRPQIRMWSRW